ncbi:MAG: MarR family transcriptional regulator [Candidatus Ranarchaeia archaeon]
MTCSGSLSWAGRLRGKRRKQTTNHQARTDVPNRVRKLLKSRRKPNRLMEVYQLLLKPISWVSAGDLNSSLKYVKRTLQGTLNRLVELGLVKKTRSLSDARITLFRAITPI